ncbi:probable protein kinase DDB_G0291842 [Diabrotica undecimpunctata]|uniref:probable protein kinase DDB_G0291842 n=1 Tax=Diabrotica undecimpunctata TaxID=50387 RepID=UPI003B6415CB
MFPAIGNRQELERLFLTIGNRQESLLVCYLTTVRISKGGGLEMELKSSIKVWTKDARERRRSSVSNVATPVYVKKRVQLDNHYNPTSVETYLNQIFKSPSALGQGAFGQVVKVTHRLNNKKFAVKRFKKEKPTRIKMNEIENNEKVGNHPNCLKYFMSWKEDGDIFMLMELSQFSLRDFSLRYKFQESMLWDCLYDISQALQHLHSHNLVHRDVKGSNIMVHGNHFKLSDFGTILDMNLYPADNKEIQRPPKDIYDLALVMTSTFMILSRQGKTMSDPLSQLIQMMTKDDARKRITAQKILRLNEMKKVERRLKVSRPIYAADQIDDIDNLLPMATDERTPSEDVMMDPTVPSTSGVTTRGAKKKDNLNRSSPSKKK